MSISQRNRYLSLTTPLDDDVLLIRRMKGVEELGRPFHYVLELSSEDADIALEDILGKSMTVRLKVGDAEERFFNGIVTSFVFTGYDDRLYNYRAVLRPWIWLLGQTSDCRIFQNTTVPDIVKAVMRDAGFSDFEENLEGNYREWEYCVQYRESKLNFVNRLMEQEGSCYYFRHEEDRHIAVIADSIMGHETVSGFESVPFHPPESTESLNHVNHISTWNIGHEVRPVESTLSAYDFKKPKADLETRSLISRDHEHAEFEVYDYPGEYYEASDGENYARIRLQERQAGYEVAEGSGNCEGLHAGALFTLTGHPRTGQDVEWLITKATYDIKAESLETDRTGGSEGSFVTTINCINSATPFRTPRRTPKPMVQGAQTAVVVGPDSDHIHVDEYGRVKVQFHWDRVGTNDENSSCWVRVSQVWAGKGYGSLHIPHIGHEVVVDFLEGDPDRPYISGRLYNADNMPPVTLPKLKHKSMIRDEFGNEIVFDSTPGDEHIVMRSPHHDSTFVLGRSKITYTSSNELNITVGDSYKKTYGQTISTHTGGKASAMFGWQGSLVLGLKGGVFVGGSVDLEGSAKLAAKLSASCELSYGTKLSYHKGPEASLGESYYYQSVNKDITLDANGIVKIIGGTKNQSVVQCLTDQLVLDYGEGTDAKEANKKRDAAKVFLATCSALSVSVGAAAMMDRAGASSAKSTAEANERVDDPGNPGSPISAEQEGQRANIATNASAMAGNDTWLGKAGIGLAALAALVAGGLKLTKKAPKSGDSEADLDSRDIKSSIRLREDGIEMSSGPELKTGIHIKQDDKLSILAEKDINIIAKGGVNIASVDKPFSAKFAKFAIDAIIEHDNLKVLK